MLKRGRDLLLDGRLKSGLSVKKGMEEGKAAAGREGKYIVQEGTRGQKRGRPEYNINNTPGTINNA